MTSLLVVKEKIMGFYKNFEVLVKIIAKFILVNLGNNPIKNML